jgi:four helix bundle protein
MDKVELERRTKQFALRITAFAATLPMGKVGDVIRYQLVKAGTSIGANYREANRAESRNDFIHKIGIVEKEASETQYWLEICDEDKFGDAERRAWSLQESGELPAIFTSSGRTAEAARAYNSQFEIRNSKFLLCRSLQKS